jgi:hypothetical protein
VSRTLKRTTVAVIGLFVIGVAIGEWLARHRVEREYRQALEARRTLELELGEVRADRDRLSGVLSDEQQHVQQLSATLSTKDTELKQVVERLTQEERIILELQGRLLAMQHQFDRLQGELAMTLESRAGRASRGEGQVVELEKVVVTQPTAGGSSLEGRVVSFNPEWRFVVIDLGWNVVDIGDVVSIYRDEHLLGKARIERVQEEISAAALLPESQAMEIQVNDVVRIL